jgi:hypothetical protein
VADNLNLSIGECVKDGGHLPQDLLSLFFDFGFTRGEENSVEDVDGEFAGEFGDRDIAGLECIAHFFLEAPLCVGNLAMFLFQVAYSGFELFSLGIRVLQSYATLITVIAERSCLTGQSIDGPTGLTERLGLALGGLPPGPSVDGQKGGGGEEEGAE